MGIRRGYSDPLIAANAWTAAHNLGLLVALGEIRQSDITSRTRRAILGIASDLESISLRHAVERVAGFRRF